MLRQERAEAVSVWEWRVPAVLFVIGLVVLLVAGFMSAGAAGGAVTLLMLALYLVVYVPLTIVAMYIVAAIFGIAFGELRSAVLKLAAITVFTGAIDRVGAWVEHPFVAGLIAIAVSWYLFSNFFDLDAMETVIAVIAISLVRFCLAWAIVLVVGALIPDSNPTAVVVPRHAPAPVSWRTAHGETTHPLSGGGEPGRLHRRAEG